MVKEDRIIRPSEHDKGDGNYFDFIIIIIAIASMIVIYIIKISIQITTIIVSSIGVPGHTRISPHNSLIIMFRSSVRLHTHIHHLTHYVFHSSTYLLAYTNISPYNSVICSGRAGLNEHIPQYILSCF